MPKPKAAHSGLPVADVVEEILLEGDAGEYAQSRAQELRDKVGAGAALDEDSVKQLIDRVLPIDDQDLRYWIATALAFHAIRTDDGAIVEAIARVGWEALRSFIVADVRLPIRRRVMAALLAAGSDARLQEAFANRLDGAVYSASDITPACDWLVSRFGIPATGRGYKRTKVAETAARAVSAAMTQDAPYRERQAPGVPRKPLEQAADKTFRPKLETLAAGSGQEADVAHRILISVDATKHRWAAVDTRLAAEKTTAGKRARAARMTASAEGLLKAAYYSVFYLPREEGAEHKRAQDLVREVAHRIEALGLPKAEKRKVDERLARSAGDAGVSLCLSSHLDIRPLVEELLEAGPKKRLTVSDKIEDALRENPSAREQLPSVSKVPKNGPVREVALLHLFAHQSAKDAAGVGKVLKALRADGPGAKHALSRLANGSDRKPFIDLVGPFLDDDDPELRFWATYFFGKLAERDRGDASKWAKPLVERLTDGGRFPGRKDTIAVSGRKTLAAVLAVTQDRERFVKLARKLLASQDPKTQRTLRTHLRELLPEALDAKS
ncbi:MAG: hypothetical protein HOV80_27355 [Polyangiaceae bacterium]|nr:hypothetical protein [Polyangiaceae bacterium]